MSNPETPDEQDRPDPGWEPIQAGAAPIASGSEPFPGGSYGSPFAVQRRSRWAALSVAVAVAALGALLGWLWAVVSPRLAVIKAEGGFLYADSEPEQPVAADGWFAIIGASTGVLVAVLAWLLLRRYRGIAVLLGLTVGSLGAAALAWYVGSKIGYAQFARARDAAELGDRLDAPLQLAMTHLQPRGLWRLFPTGVASVQALVAAFTYTFLAGFSSHPDLRDDPETEPESDQFGPGVTGSSENATGTART